MESRGALEGLSARGAVKRSVCGVHRRVNLKVAAIHERAAAHLTDMPRHVGRVSATMGTQQRSRPVTAIAVLTGDRTNHQSKVHK